MSSDCDMVARLGNDKIRAGDWKEKKSQKEQTGTCSLLEWNTKSIHAAGVVRGYLEVPAIRLRSF